MYALGLGLFSGLGWSLLLCYDKIFAFLELIF
jgi:hypothetical protein